MKSDMSVGLEVVRTLANSLLTISQPKRLEIVQYCIQPRRFTDIVLDLRLNPASFTFHLKILEEHGLIKKSARGVYQTTDLGKRLLEIINQASKIVVKQD